MSWAMIARMWELASTDEAKRSFKNGVLGETWVETGEAPDWQRLYERREDWQIGIVPKGGLFLTAGADVQKDRIEISVWAWGRGLESWLVDHIIIEGGPEHAATWAQVSECLSRTWPHSGGVRLGLAKLAVDTGYQAPAVYAWARRRNQPRRERRCPSPWAHVAHQGSRRTVTSPNIAILRFSDATPAGRPLLSISVSRHLDAIEKFTGVRPTISECVMSCRMHPESIVADPSPSGRLDGNRVIIGEIVSQFFFGGLDNADYILTYLITFSDGSVEAFDAVISARRFMGL